MEHFCGKYLKSILILSVVFSDRLTDSRLGDQFTQLVCKQKNMLMSNAVLPRCIINQDSNGESEIQ